MNDNVVDAIKTRADIQDDINLLSDVCNKYNRVSSSIDRIIDAEELNSLDRIRLMSKVTSTDEDIIDKESIDLNNNLDAEDIKDKITYSLGIVKDLFKSTRQKLFESMDKAKNVWVKDNSIKIQELYKELESKKDLKSIDNNILSKANNIMSSNLNTIYTGNIELDDLVLLAKNMTESFRLDYTTNIDSLLGNLIKRKDSKLVGSDYIKVTRLDGRNLSYIVVGDDFGVKGIKYYDSIKIPNKISVLNAKNFNKEYAKKCLDIATEINNILPDIVDSTRKELAMVEDSIKDISDKSKWSTSKNGMTIGTLTAYIGGAILVSFGVYAGGLTILSSLLSTAGTASMKVLSTIVRTYMSLGAPSRSLIGVTAISAGLGIPAKIGKWFKKSSNDIDYNEDYYRNIEDKAKIKLLNARVELTTKYSLDAIYGMYFLTIELISTASIVLNYLDKEVNK